MSERHELRAELRRLALDEELPERARRTIRVVLADVARRERDGQPVPGDEELRALVLAAREVARGVGGLSDVAVAALLCLVVDRVTLATSPEDGSRLGPFPGERRAGKRVPGPTSADGGGSAGPSSAAFVTPGSIPSGSGRNAG